jgi:NADH dehydrogenase [ubiquinone] 1 alpha subcomplex assembly factor 6
VAKALAEVVPKFKLTKLFFSKILNRRDKDIDSENIRDLQDLEEYSEETASSLLYLSLECAGIRNTNADHAASHIGKALGIATILRATPIHATKKMCYLPMDLMSKVRVISNLINCSMV